MNAPPSYPNRLLRRRSLSDGVPRSSLWYSAARRVFQATMCCLWKVRVFNRHYEPAHGGVLYISNHQSFLDPMLVGFGLRRPVNFMARDSLFRFPVFKQLIASWNAFPVRRGTADLTAIKEALRRIKAGGQVLVFAEGTRTTDGRIGPLLPGVAMLAQRAAAWTVPVVIDGAFEAWPRTQMLPSLGSVVVRYDQPIAQEQARKMTGQQFVESVRQTMIEMQTDVRRRVGRPALEYE